jgi:cell division protein FtsB
MRFVTVVLFALLALVQYPLWWGHGGWIHVHELEEQLARQQQRNAQLKLRNDRLAGEVQDLQNGTTAIQERARYELGMIKDDEVFVQFVSPNAVVPDTGSNTSARAALGGRPVAVVPEPQPRVKPSKESRRKSREEQQGAARDGRSATPPGDIDR